MRQNRRLGQMAVPVGAMLVTLGAGACGELPVVNPGELRVETVPTRPHLISGGDALVAGGNAQWPMDSLDPCEETHGATESTSRTWALTNGILHEPIYTARGTQPAPIGGAIRESSRHE